MPNYTLAQALSAGWMWQIPKQDKLGCGYVFCDKYIDFDQAQQELEEKLGRKISPIKQIKFNSGRSDKFLFKNYLSVGLSAAFLEPLEATSIHSTLEQLKVFFEEYTLTDYNYEKYNQYIGDMYDSFRDFIVIHYRTKRKEQFWIDRWNDKISSNTANLLDAVKYKIPRDLDFMTLSRTVNSVLYLNVLDGLELLDKNIAKNELEFYQATQQSNNTLDLIKESWSKIIPMFDDHRNYINLITQT